MADKKKETLGEEVETTMACSAFAEEGEPCPIGGGEAPSAKGGKGVLEEVETAMACSAFAEDGEPCPIGCDDSGPVDVAPREAGDDVVKAVEDAFACTAFHEQNEECPICKK